MKQSRLLIYCRQAGGAAFIIPVLKRLESLNIEMVVFSSGKATQTFINHGITTEDNPETSSLKALLESDKTCKLIVTDTTYSVDSEIQHFLWDTAACLGIPSLGIIDSWVNYGERFLDVKGKKHYPDQIAVIDDIAYREAVEEGVPAGKLVMSGHPRFDQLKNEYETNDQSYRTRLFQKYHIRERDRCLLFVSDPITRFGFKEHLGYDEGTILREVTEAVRSFNDENLKLLIKPHPEDDRNTWKNLVEKIDFPCQLIDENRIIPLLIAVDLVIGMYSIVLVDALLLGKPILSVQIGLKCRDWLMINRVGITRAILTQRRLRKCLRAFLNDTMSFSSIDISTRLGVNRTCQLISSLIERQNY